MLKFFAGVIISFSVPFYWVTEMLFRIFFVLAEGQLVSPDQYKILISNFYVILGVILLFILSFSMLKSMVNPEEKKGTESTKKIIMNLITSAVIMVLLPTIFTFAFDLQTSIIGSEYNVIGKLFGFGTSNTEIYDESKSNVKSAASTVTNSIFTAFFNVNLDNCDTPDDLESCQEKVYSNDGETSFREMVKYVNDTGQLRMYLQFSEAWTDQEIEFNVLLSIICGIILIYVVASFCIDMAIRLVKLVFYQLIAPIPLFFRVVPDTKLSGTFNQWVKVTLATYFEVYIRIIIVYFVLYICLQVEGMSVLDEVANSIGIFGRLIAKALIFIGLITFMRQAPKLISEITGIDTGNMKLGIREKLAAGGAFTAGAIIGGGLTAGVRNAVSGYQNTKNKWKETKGFGGKAGLIAGALGSTVAGAASGTVRSGKAGLGAKSYKDMKGSAASGATAAVNARDKRALYKSRHGGTTKGVILGHYSDTIDNIKRWSGSNPLDDLLATQKTINQLQSERKSIDNEAFDIIDGDFAKGKAGAKLVYDANNEIGKALGITHSMDHYRILKAKLDEAKIHGSAQEIQDAEVAVANYRKKWADQLSDIALKGKTEWEGLDEKVQAELSKLRIATDTYREDLAKNYTAGFISSLPNAEDILDVEKGLNVEHSVLDTIKDKMKIKQTEVTNEINKINRKEQEKEGK